jgi:hypothetical protein
VAAAVTTIAAATGCAGEPPAPSARPSAPATSASSSAPSSATPEPSDSPETDAMERPAKRSGQLSRRDFPRPRELGAGWSYVVDPGSTEEGYAGNGTPALARDPGEIVQTAVPFGCARRARMPRPKHALEVDYAAGDTKVIAVRSQFADRANARAFFAGRKANLAACVDVDGGAVGPYVSGLKRYGAGVLVNGRTQQSDPWTELAVLDGDCVVLVAAQSRLDDQPLAPDDLPTLARRFRAR